MAGKPSAVCISDKGAARVALGTLYPSLLVRQWMSYRSAADFPASVQTKS
jgi:hypothetical protein